MTIGSTLELTFFPLWFRLVLVCVLLLISIVLYFGLWLAAIRLALLALGRITQAASTFLLSLFRRIITSLGFSPRKTTRTFNEEGKHQQQSREERYEERKEHVSSKQPEQNEDPYSILGVPRGASREAIQKAYREQMKLYHPDRVQHLGEALQKTAHHRTLAIQAAYDALHRKYAHAQP